MIGAVGSCSGKGVEDAQLKDPQFQTASKPTVIEVQGDQFWPLSGKPYFNVIISKSQLKPMNLMILPAEMRRILPSKTIPAFLVYKGKEWEMVYLGEDFQKRNKRFGSEWKTFAIDNKLKVGDACVFELMECRNDCLKFRVQILRGDIPSKFEDNTNSENEDTTIIVG